MSARDAANLLIAINGCPLAKNVKTRLPTYRALPWSESDAHWRIPQRHRRLRGLFLATDLTFGTWLEQMIELAKPEPDGSTQLSRMLDVLVARRDAKRAEQSEVELPLPSLELTFWAGRPSVECAVRIPKTSGVVNSEYHVERPIAATVLFEGDIPGEWSPFRGDREEAVIITDATITWLAEVLQEGEDD
jgi:hypothetical protein